MPDLSLLEGAGILAVGALSGRFWPARRRGRKVKPVKPFCGCEHHYSYHEPAAIGAPTVCHAQVKGQITKWDGYGTACGWEMLQCTCKQYTGPEPLPEYYARPLS